MHVTPKLPAENSHTTAKAATHGRTVSKLPTGNPSIETQIMVKIIDGEIYQGVVSDVH